MLPLIVVPDMDPIALQIGSLKVYWYGIAYVVGIGLGWAFARLSNGFHENQLPIHSIDDLIFYTALGAVLGGRIGYCLFYDFQSLSENPLLIFAIWKGGMSFHGGFLGAATSIIIFSKLTDNGFFDLSDRIVVSVPIGLFFGRIANFINQELWGTPSELPWAMIFSNPLAGGVARHPSQLYEALLEGLILFIVLIYLLKKGCRSGVLTAYFLFLYGIFRFTVEFFRQPDSHLGYFFGGNLTLGQILTIPMLILGLFLIFFLRLQNRRREN